MTECDGVMMERRSVTDVASTYVLCPRFEEPSVCEFQVGERKELWSRGGVVWIKVWSNRIKMWSDRIKMWIKMQSKVEQRILFLFDSKLESCLEASSFKYRITEISEKGLY